MTDQLLTERRLNRDGTPVDLWEVIPGKIETCQDYQRV